MESLLMKPGPGERLVRFVGDPIRFQLHGVPEDWRALVRTNVGRAQAIRDQIIRGARGPCPLALSAWHDVPMRTRDGTRVLNLALTEVGYFAAKAYAVDPNGHQHWPGGPDLGINVQPNDYRTGNILYCAFVRMFGATKNASIALNEAFEEQLGSLDKKGYTVIPPSGKLRDLTRQLPHIIQTLGCRILHLLPVNPTPTVYARFGRFGSPYASLDLMAIDPALVEFDRRTTGLDQFRELTYATHCLGGRVFLDIVTNHTGWGSPLEEGHPELFLRDPEGRFVSPGAWGVTWEDLVEVDHRGRGAWEYLAEVFLTWCRRGVDGFRCDAGYKVPCDAWRYIIACVREEFPETVFLLEGLGGPLETTENLLTEGGMQWAYSELFQNFNGSQVSHYLDYAHRQSQRAGLYVHYSETHDNDRLAKRSRAWSLLRNRLSALTSVSGGFGFTGGVEWLAKEKIRVHGSSGMNWDAADNIVAELAELNRLLANHPCFFDNAKLQRVSPPESVVYALHRTSAEGLDQLVVLANTDADHEQSFVLEVNASAVLGDGPVDLLKQVLPLVRKLPDGRLAFRLAPAACYCLAAKAEPLGLAGQAYRDQRAAAGAAVVGLREVLQPEELVGYSWQTLADVVRHDPICFLGSLPYLKGQVASGKDVQTTLLEVGRKQLFPPVATWRRSDRNRIFLVPPHHWLLIEDAAPFRALLKETSPDRLLHAQCFPVRDGYAAFFRPRAQAADVSLVLERYAATEPQLEATIRYLAPEPHRIERFAGPASARGTDRVLLTNGRGGMARLCVDLGHVESKYDCLLGANLHASVPVDRHILAKRIRIWANANGFVSALSCQNLIEFEPGPPARWRFVASAGEDHAVEFVLEADMLPGCNTTVLRLTRPAQPPPVGTELPSQFDVRLIVRVDIEDRSFHWETKRDSAADAHFSHHARPLTDGIGFEFCPGNDRALRCCVDTGTYHHQGEWCEQIPHPTERERGMADRGDAFSPGWFELSMGKGASTFLVVSAEAEPPEWPRVREFDSRRAMAADASPVGEDRFARGLVQAAQAFVVRRGSAKTIIAGYPWFLDWGRDSLISARGLLVAGMHQEVTQLLVTFGRFEENGTLPNSIHGEDATNRDTSDAPLWYAVVAAEAAQAIGERIFRLDVNDRGKKVSDVLLSIAQGYLKGTPNGVRVDPESGLVWSPKHFTWMDTNFPAGTPRVGYPVEIQVLWFHLLRLLARLELPTVGASWEELAEKVEASLLRHFWLEERGYLSDLLIAAKGEPAKEAVADDALRSNCLFAVSFGLLTGAQARRCVDAATKYLVVPGALRSLAPLPMTPPLAIHGNQGELLNNPAAPYWGRYEGDEDTRRKPAYHNGTAWTWTFPTFCEALARAWDFHPESVAAARAYLGSMDRLLNEGCLGQLPEILDGDAPHQQRGCDAQAWSITEALRVWELLSAQKGS